VLCGKTLNVIADVSLCEKHSAAIYIYYVTAWVSSGEKGTITCLWFPSFFSEGAFGWVGGENIKKFNTSTF
jgi:hypothetical protein